MTTLNRRWIAGVILFVSQAVAAAALSGKVITIADGDTLTVLVDNRPVKIRLAGIDSPEKRQPFGQRAKQNLSAMAAGKMADVQYSKKDKYLRIVGKVLVGEPDVNLEQVRAGMAWHYKAYEKEQSAIDRHAYAEAEVVARQQRVGLWTDQSPTPPWEFRHRQSP